MSPPSSPQLRERARLALDQFFHPDSLDIWVPLLQDHTMQPFLMGAIGGGLHANANANAARQAVGEWVPPAERAKEPKGRRGWEKLEVGAAHRGGGWVCRHLVGVVSAGVAQLQVQVLYALMALGKDNPALGNALRVETDGECCFTPGCLPPVLRSELVQVTRPCEVLLSCYDLEALMSVLRRHIGAFTTTQSALRH